MARPFRSALVWMTATFAVAGVVAAGVFLSRSLSPSAAARASLPAFDVGGIRAGQAKLFTIGPRRGALAVRDAAGVLRLFDLSLSEAGDVHLPDIEWWRHPMATCTDFTVQRDAGGSAYLGCSDAAPSAFWAAAWRWGLDGRCLGDFCRDMPAHSFVLEGDRARLTRL